MSTDILMCTVEEASRMLGVSRTLAYRLIKDGQLRSIKIGRRRLVPMTSLESFIAEQINSANAS
jgi:excisionase family DNA binding protein